MRGGVAALQHTLTPQAAVVLRNAVADARRRGHSQVQPLHVAAMLLACPGSPLRQACIQSHPYTATHPLQCRALELCFDVALERLPASASAVAGLQPPGLSNALVAALKRAQAQQRRGCPEQQQQPLLAVRVDMEHLIISILDDPSVSRVMREAGFDSTHVKCNMEETAVSTTPPVSATSNSSDSVGIRPGASMACGGLPTHPLQSLKMTSRQIQGQVMERSNVGEDLHRRLYDVETSQRRSIGAGKFDIELSNVGNSMSPNLGPVCSKGKDVDCIFHVLLRAERCNPILIGDSTQHLNSLVQELSQRIERADVPSQIQGAQFFSVKFASLASGMCNRRGIDAKLGELRALLDRCMPAGAILYLGDLQCLVEPTPSGFMAFSPVQYATSELGRLLLLYGKHRVWAIGTASPQSYLKCQTQYPLLQSQWQLQPVQFCPLEARKSNWPGSFVAKDSCWKASVQKGITALEEVDTRNSATQEQAWMREQEATKTRSQSLLASSPAVGDVHFPTPGVVKSTASLWPERHIRALNHPPQSKEEEEAKSGLWKLQQNCYLPPSNRAGPPESKSTEIPMFQKYGSPLGPNLHRSAGLPQHHYPFNDPLAANPMAAINPNLRSFNSSDPVENAVGELPTQSGLDSSRCVSSVSGGSSLGKTKPSTVQTDLALGIHPSPVVVQRNPQTDAMFGMPRMPAAKVAPSSQCAAVQCAENRMIVQAHHDRLQDVQNCTSSLLKTSEPTEAHAPGSPRPPSSVVRMPVSGPRPLPCEEPLTESFSKYGVGDFKILCHELTSRIPWQAESMKSISNVVWDRRSSTGRRRGPSVKSDVWLLLLGPDKLGKREVAKGLAKLVYGSENNIICSSFDVGTRGLEGVADGVRRRGKTCLDRLVHAVRQKPFSVLLLEDVDQADVLVRASLVKAMERGRLADSNNREASFANVIVLMTASLGSDFPRSSASESHLELSDMGLSSRGGIKLSVGEAEHDRAVLNGHDGVAVICQDQMGHLGSVSMRLWSHLNRESVDRDMGWGACKRRKLSATGRLPGFDLNLSAEENGEDAPEDPEEEGFPTMSKACAPNQLEQHVIDKVITSAHRILSSNFCSGVDEIVVFHPVGLRETFGPVLKELQGVASSVVDIGGFLELDLPVLEQMALARLRTSGGDEAFKFWVGEVFSKSLAELVAFHGDLSGKAVKLVGAEQSDYLHSIPLPSAIVCSP